MAVTASLGGGGARVADTGTSEQAGGHGSGLGRPAPLGQHVGGPARWSQAHRSFAMVTTARTVPRQMESSGSTRKGSSIWIPAARGVWQESGGEAGARASVRGTAAGGGGLGPALQHTAGMPGSPACAR